MRHSLVGAGVVLFGCLGMSAASHAQSPAPDAALAESLFRDGKKLMEDGKPQEACPKLAESHRLDPGGGTVLLLALCYEAEGKLASAWAAFGDVVGFAIRDGRQDRERRGREHLQQLEPRLSYLTITASGTVEIRRGGQPVPRAAWGTAVAVDPAEYVIEACATGKICWTTRVRMLGEGSREIVTVPPLLDAPAPLASSPPAVSLPPPAAAPPERRRSSLRTGAWIAGGVGAAGVVVGSIFGVLAFQKAASANDRCPVKDCNDASAVSKSSDADRAAVVANTAFLVGAVGLVVGGTLFLAEPAPAAGTTLRVAPGLVPGWAGASVSGGF